MFLRKINLMSTIFFILFFVFSPSVLVAQDIEFSASVDSAKVALGDSIQLVLSVAGKKDIPPLNLPAIDGFNIRYLGPSTRVSIVNGQYSSLKAFTYSLVPTKTGTLQIPSFSLTLDGKNYSTQGISVEVIDPAGEGAESGSATLNDKIFIRLQLAKEKAYINEKVPIKIFLYVNELSFQDIQYPQIKNIGIAVDEFGPPKQYQQIINGRKYSIVEFDANIYPTREGEVRVGPATISGSLITNQNQSGSIRGSVFDDDFFDSFFNRYEKRPLTLSSQEIALTVMPLPEKDKPHDFSGAVGQFQFDVSASPLSVREGDPITLRMSIKGSGNFNAVDFPLLKGFDRFKIYDPKITEEKGRKEYEGVIIPLASNVKEIPSISFSYYDPETSQYKTAVSPPIAITVLAVDEKDNFAVISLPSDNVNVKEEVLGSDIIYIKEKIGRLYYGDKVRKPVRIFVVGIILIFAVWLSIYILYKQTHRLRTDIVYAKKMLAPQQARRGIAKAKDFLYKNDVKGFYDAIFRMMQEYLGNKFHLSAGSVTVDNIIAKMQKGDSKEKAGEIILQIFNECDKVRYASINVSSFEMKEILNKAEKLIDYLERNVK